MILCEPSTLLLTAEEQVSFTCSRRLLELGVAVNLQSLGGKSKDAACNCNCYFKSVL